MSEQAPENHDGFWSAFLDEDWLARTVETALEPDLPIVDPHHHLWERPRAHYPVEDLLKDLTSGHNVRATVYLETMAYYRETGPDAFKPVGETDYVAKVAEQVARTPGAPAVAAGIIGRADLTLGAAVQDVLEAHIEVGLGRFRGVRSSLHFDRDVHLGFPNAPEGLSKRPEYREGFARLGALGLVCDIMSFHGNLPDVADLADAFPDTPFIVNHCGCPIAVGPYADRQDEVFRIWRANMADLARRPNVNMKLGGLGGPFFGPMIPFKLRERPRPASSEELARLMGPFMETAIELFGPDRCMFESNFPADKYDCSYAVLWNAFKRIAQGCSADDKRALFSTTASRVYSLGV